MAAAFIHYFLGLGLAYLFGYSGVDALVLGLVGAIQDIDFLTMFFYRRMMKSPASRMFTHRGITHSVLFAAVCGGAALFFSRAMALFIVLNFLLHIFTDYVTAWGVAPFQPFSFRRYSLGLMTIFDVPLTLLSLLVGGSGFFSVNPLLPFAAFFGYIVLRYGLKRRLPYKRLVPMGLFTYVFCFYEDDYRVGKVDVLGREKTVEVPRVQGDVDPEVVGKVVSKLEESMLSHLLEYPTFSAEGDDVVVRDARSYLFPRAQMVGFTVVFDRKTEHLYMETAGRRIKVDR